MRLSNIYQAFTNIYQGKYTHLRPRGLVENKTFLLPCLAHPAFYNYCHNACKQHRHELNILIFRAISGVHVPAQQIVDWLCLREMKIDYNKEAQQKNRQLILWVVTAFCLDNLSGAHLDVDTALRDFACWIFGHTSLCFGGLFSGSALIPFRIFQAFQKECHVKERGRPKRMLDKNHDFFIQCLLSMADVVSATPIELDII